MIKINERVKNRPMSMANEGIRLPSDTTVASQKVKRGHGLPETKALPTKTEPLPPPSPLLTVVLQSTPLLEGKRQSLYELVLQNDPKSEPPIRLPSDTHIKPGTSLLLELDDNGQYRPVEKPNVEQLQRLVQLELEFWRAHLLPKTDSRSFPDLPSTDTLRQLSQNHPALKPLIQWLTQRPDIVTKPLIHQWFKEVAPLSPWRAWAPMVSATVGKAPSPSEMSQPMVSAPPTENATDQKLSALIVPDPRLTQAIGLQPAIGSTPKQVQTAVDQLISSLLGRAPGTTTQQAPTNTLQTNTPLSPSPNSQSEPTRPSLNFMGQIFRLSPDAPTVTGKDLHYQYTAVRLANHATPASLTMPTAKTSGTETPQNTTAGPERPQPASNLLTTTEQRNLIPVLIPSSAALKNTSQTLPPGLPNSSTLFMNSQQLSQQLKQNQTSASADQAPKINWQHQPLIVPGHSTDRGQNIPLEIKLGQWLNAVQGEIAASPAHLQHQLKYRASELLKQIAEGQINVTAHGPGSSAQSTKNRTEEPALHALQAWLEATQARLQHAAVQTTTMQWNASDTPIQQMHLPLIWLGLTSWADIEWWQEKPNKKKDNDKEAAFGRRWRMKIYLTLAPLAPMCADIDWSADATQITFWSEDRSTLNHLSQLMPMLHRWTDGLGEKSLATRHGMPKRAAERKADQTEQHLVDIRT
ncbi:MAG: hypothetical protein R3309_01900 [Reinekea sp.]|nr:hypothetical protein [Reinekea sp.]